MESAAVDDTDPRCQYARVEGCGRRKSRHYVEYGYGGHAFVPPSIAPKPSEIASASAVTEWDCPFCAAANDVHGEGALYSWMECGECGKFAYLVSEYDESQTRDAVRQTHA